MALAGAAPDERCQRYARLARVLAEAPVAAVSIVGPAHQWFRGRDGTSLEGTPRDISFCAHAIHDTGVFEVPDARADERFAGNPMVLGEPGIRFYAGCPIRLPGELAVGSLCVIDTVPRRLEPSRKAALRDLADCLQSELSLLWSVTDMDDMAKQLFELLPAQGAPHA